MSKEITEIVITNKKIINYFNKNRDVDIEKLILVNIELYETMKTVSLDNSTTVNNIMSTLQNQTKDITTLMSQVSSSNDIYKNELSSLKSIYTMNIENIKKDIDNINTTITNKIYESKDTYIKELREILKSRENESIININGTIDKNNNALVNKLSLLLNDTLPTSINKHQTDIIKDFKEDMLKTLNKVIEYDPTVTIDKISNIVENKYNNLAFNIQDQLLKNININDDKISSNLLQIKEIAIKSSSVQDKITDELSSYLNKYKTSILKGNLGENRLHNIINDEYLSSEIINTSNSTGQGDLILKRPNKVPILFETKNYNTNVKKDEVDKFIRDIDNTKYNGIMLSQTSGIIGKDNFQIDIHNNNILVYIHKADYDISKIKLAVNTIDFLSDKILTMKDNKINIDAELLKEINSEYQQLIVIKENLNNNLKEYYKKTLDLYSNIDLPCLNKFLSNFYANNNKNIKICEICKKYESTSLLSLARHIQACKKKHNIIDNSEESSENTSNNEEIEEIVETPKTEIIKKNNKKSNKKS
jgi:hypothetical protein